MARRAEDVETGTERAERWQPSPDVAEQLREDVAAYRAGTLETVSWADFRPVLRRWIDECAKEPQRDGEP